MLYQCMHVSCSGGLCLTHLQGISHSIAYHAWCWQFCLWVITDLIPWGRLGPAHTPPGVWSMCSIEGQRGSTCVVWVLDTTKSTNVLPHHPPCWSSAANHNSKLFSSNYFLHPYGAMFQAGWIRPQYLAPNGGAIILQLSPNLWEIPSSDHEDTTWSLTMAQTVMWPTANSSLVPAKYSGSLINLPNSWRLELMRGLHSFFSLATP